ncbi:MAG: hypothetical protein K2J10_06165 [Muribaculaceae bacterium]|nr:hypothetical protein [Muribaculaceae bacterium]
MTDADGKVEQDNHYYPYGMLMAESSDILAAALGNGNKAANPYLYGSKEYLTTGGANLLDFTARTYDPSILIFHTQDPFNYKFPRFNSYGYCAADPINYIDPNGEKIYYINMEGRPTTPGDDLTIDGIDKAEYEEDMDDVDQIIIIGDDGMVCGKTQLFLKGTIEKTITLPENKGFGFEVRGDEEGEHIFVTLSKNITGKNDIEFSHIKAGDEGTLGLNFVTTSHTPNKEASAFILIDIQLKYNYTLRDINHSHSLVGYASGGDIDFKNRVDLILPSHVKPGYNIYCVPKNKYYPY